MNTKFQQFKGHKTFFIINHLQNEQKSIVNSIFENDTLLKAFYELYTMTYLDSNYDESQIKMIKRNPLLNLLRLITNTSRYICLLTSAALQDNLLYYKKYFNEEEDFINDPKENSSSYDNKDYPDEEENDNDGSTSNNNNDFYGNFKSIKNKNAFETNNNSNLYFMKKQSSKFELKKTLSSKQPIELKNKEIGYYFILNAYNKAYKTYVSSAVYLDEYLFQLNPFVVNVEKEIAKLTNQKKSRMTFNTFRIYMNSWFNLVLSELTKLTESKLEEQYSTNNLSQSFREMIYLDFPEFKYSTQTLQEHTKNNHHHTKLNTCFFTKDSFSYQINNNFSKYNNYSHQQKKSLTPNSLTKSVSNNQNNNLNTQGGIYQQEETYFNQAVSYLTKRVLIRSLHKYFEKNQFPSNKLFTKFSEDRKALFTQLSKHNINTNSKISYETQEALDQYFIDVLNVEFFDEFSLLQDIINSFIDCSCSEVNVYKLNLTTFKAKLFNSFAEPIILQNYERVFKHIFDCDMRLFKEFIANEDLYKSLPQCSKKRIEEQTLVVFISDVSSSLQNHFSEYIKKQLHNDIGKMQEKGKDKIKNKYKIKIDKDEYGNDLNDEAFTNCAKQVLKSFTDTAPSNFVNNILFKEKQNRFTWVVNGLIQSLDEFIKKKADNSGFCGDLINSKQECKFLCINNAVFSSINNNKNLLNANFTNSSIFTNSFNSNQNNISILSVNSNNSDERIPVLSSGVGVANNSVNNNVNIAISSPEKQETESISYLAYFIFVNFLFKTSGPYNYHLKCSKLEYLEAFLENDLEYFQFSDNNIQKELKRRNIETLINFFSADEIIFSNDFREELKSRDSLIKSIRSKLILEEHNSPLFHSLQSNEKLQITSNCLSKQGESIGVGKEEDKSQNNSNEDII